VDYSLADQIHASAKLKDVTSVKLWLGADIMLDYGLEEAKQVLVPPLASLSPEHSPLSPSPPPSSPSASHILGLRPGGGPTCGIMYPASISTDPPPSLLLTQRTNLHMGKSGCHHSSSPGSLFEK